MGTRVSIDLMHLTQPLGVEIEGARAAAAALDHCQHRRADGHCAHSGAFGEDSWRRVSAGACITGGTRAACAAAAALNSVLMMFACRELMRRAGQGCARYPGRKGFSPFARFWAMIDRGLGSWQGLFGALEPDPGWT